MTPERPAQSRGAIEPAQVPVSYPAAARCASPRLIAGLRKERWAIWYYYSCSFGRGSEKAALFFWGSALRVGSRSTEAVLREPEKQAPFTQGAACSLPHHSFPFSGWKPIGGVTPGLRAPLLRINLAWRSASAVDKPFLISLPLRPSASSARTSLNRYLMSRGLKYTGCSRPSRVLRLTVSQLTCQREANDFRERSCSGVGISVFESTPIRQLPLLFQSVWP